MSWEVIDLAQKIAGAEFAARRKKLGFATRRRLAEEIGVTEAAVHHWETGRREIPRYAVRFLERLEKKGR